MKGFALIAELQLLGKKQVVYANNLISLRWPFGAVGTKMPSVSVDGQAKFHRAQSVGSPKQLPAGSAQLFVGRKGLEADAGPMNGAVELSASHSGHRVKPIGRLLKRRMLNESVGHLGQLGLKCQRALFRSERNSMYAPRVGGFREAPSCGGRRELTSPNR